MNKAKPTRFVLIATAMFGLGSLITGCATGTQDSSVERVELNPSLSDSIASGISIPATPTPAPLQRTVPQTYRTDLHPKAPDDYIVRKGDTLWDISSRFLKSPWKWPELWEANPAIKNPHLIYPGDRISLYYVDGQPRLGINRNRGNGQFEPSIRIQALDSSDSGIPIQTIKPFLVYPDILAEEALKQAAHIVDSQEEHLIYGTGHTVYARDVSDRSVGARYSIYRPGQRFLDPKTGEFLGFEAMHAGEAEVTRGGNPTTLKLVDTSREVLRGDRLIIEKSRAEDYHFIPHAPPAGTEGSVISLVDALQQAANYQIAVLNLGTRNGIEEGHVLALNQQGRTVLDRYAHDQQSKTIRLPEERSGLIMVFRSFEKISYGLIMESERPVRVGDKAVAP